MCIIRIESERRKSKAGHQKLGIADLIAAFEGTQPH